MDLSKLAPGPNSRKKRKRFGRGEASGHGKTCCRGGKGQTARKSGPVRAGFEGGQMPLYRRLPKMGFVSRQQVLGLNRYNVVNLSVLEHFDTGATIDQKSLIAAGYAKDTDCKAGLKILGTGNLTKKINVKADAISVSAKAKIESLGGTVEVIS